MKLKPEENWTTTNNKVPFTDSEVERINQVLPDARQVAHAQKPFYCFMHFGMNTATGREWGNATETVEDFTITKIKPNQWVKAVKASGATGVIFTAKHHDGFCLWDTQTTDFNVMNTLLATDVVQEVSLECKANGLDFGVYLSPWDMHEPSYATQQYNDFFCNQLTELLSNYGEIFEVWLDGAKGAEAQDFLYDWDRYYQLIRTLQPDANIAVCGPDIRWIGNEHGFPRKREYCVVPEYLTVAETVSKPAHLRREKHPDRLTSKDMDLGSRAVLAKNQYLKWYPAEADVSIRRGWFYPGGGKVKSVRRLFRIYLSTVGRNAFLLLNVPPSDKGVVARCDKNRLKKLGDKIASVTANPVIVQKFGELRDTQGVLEFQFGDERTLRYCIIREDILFGQRVEKFDLFIKKPNGKYKRVYKGDVIGMQRIIPLKAKAIGAVLIIRQSRSTPVIESVGFYE